MIQHRHNAGPDSFMIGVTIEPPVNVRLTALEKLVRRLGEPKAVDRACTHLMYASCALSLAYIVLWLFVLQGVIRDTLDPSMGQALVLSLAWAPIMALQLFVAAVRFGSTTLQLKEAQQYAELATGAFLGVVQDCVQDAVGRWAAMRDAAAEKPTIQ